MDRPKLKEECHKCKSYNKKATSSYRCYVWKSCQPAYDEFFNEFSYKEKLLMKEFSLFLFNMKITRCKGEGDCETYRPSEFDLMSGTILNDTEALIEEFKDYFKKQDI